jgi:hypothetical protein
VYGAKGSNTWYTSVAGMPLANVIGAQARADDIRDVGIFPTDERQIIGTTQNAGVLEWSAALYAESRLQCRPAVRPKLGIALGPSERTTYFIDLADGYHSNDARGVTRSGAPIPLPCP